MKRDRFLIGILVGIAVLVVVSLAVFFSQKASQGYVAETTPAGVVHNFFFAYQQGDYERAFSYLADGENKPSLAEFRSKLSQEGLWSFGDGVKIQDYEIVQNESGSREAVVDLMVIHAGSGPFDPGYNSYTTAILVEKNGEWKIKEMPYWYWWDWYPDIYPQR
jgi:hypothetical protein